MSWRAVTKWHIDDENDSLVPDSPYLKILILTSLKTSTGSYGSSARPLRDSAAPTLTKTLQLACENNYRLSHLNDNHLRLRLNAI